MAATPIYAIPYPVGTDRVMDGDNAMQAIAQRVEVLLETFPKGCLGAWTPLAGAFTPTQGAIDVFGVKTRTLLAGRVYRVTVSIGIIRSIAGDTSVVLLKVDNTDWMQVNLYHSQAGGAMAATFVTYVGGGGTSKTFLVNAFRASGNGNISVHQGGAVPGFMAVEDMGPNPPA